MKYGMKNKAIILTGDYWHPTKSIEPLIPLLFNADKWDVTLTEKPSALIECTEPPKLFVSFKDPIENDQIPTPIWCDNEWSGVLERYIKQDGMGFLAVHCGLTDLPKEHIISREILKGFFVNHPPQCPVAFIPEKRHPITEGVTEFTFPQIDEHYIIETASEADTEILAFTTSEYGRQPALWAHELENGRVCAVTPGHDTPNLICPEYLKILKNAVNWCSKII